MHADPVRAQVSARRPHARPAGPASPDPSALSPLAHSFLHACSPPIIHGNLTSDTIFIQHNGLIKIGSGARGRGGGGAGDPRTRAEDARRPIPLTPLFLPRFLCSVAPHLFQRCVGTLGNGGRWRGPPGSSPRSP